jgi:hypothetical protein
VLSCSARAFSAWRLRHLTHDGEPRREKPADGSQNQENDLSVQSEGASDEKFSSAMRIALATELFVSRLSAAADR